MSDYLLQIAIGPIQDFISAARRTRDLWFGSTMLSEIAKAVALSVSQHGGNLIFPSATEEQLSQDRELSVANVILAEVNGAEPEKLKEISDVARRTAQACFESYAQPVFSKMREWVNKERWDAQIEDIIEFYSAWVPVNGNYAAARKQVARLLAARKNIRDFEPAPCPASVPKSSLDGLRESVFREKLTDDGIKRLPKGVRIKAGEALDAVGLIKRVPTGGDETFPSVSRVALDSWIRGRGRAFVQMPEIRDWCEALVNAGALTRVKGGRDNPFPYEGVVLLPSRHAAMIADSGGSVEAKDLCAKIAQSIDANFKGKGRDRPLEPYLAFLVADGDRMGATLSGMRSAEAHRNFSSELAKFAGEARKIVEEYHGVCVYTGGDDVMAFLPLDTVLVCARALHDKFHALMGGFGDTPPTLSVGVSIAHAMEDLELQLEYGRNAESAAKKDVDGKAVERGNDRNGLAVSVRSRGNIAVTVREQWNDTGGEGLKGTPLDQRLEWWARRFLNGEIPNKFPYELRENAAFYNGWTDAAVLKSAVKGDVVRIFNRKDISLSSDEKEIVRKYIEDTVEDSASIRALSDELILAQWIAFGMDQVMPEEEAERKGAAE